MKKGRERDGDLVTSYPFASMSHQAHEYKTLPAPKPDLSFARPPKSAVAQFFWRGRMWFETTFVLSLMEPWEKVLVLTILTVVFSLFMTGLVTYLPQGAERMHRRAVYYLWGQEGGDIARVWKWANWGAADALTKGEL